MVLLDISSGDMVVDISSGHLKPMHKATDISNGHLELMHKTIKDGVHGNMGHTVLTHNPIQCGIHTSSGGIMLDRTRELASKTCTALIKNKARVEETCFQVGRIVAFRQLIVTTLFHLGL